MIQCHLKKKKRVILNYPKKRYWEVDLVYTAVGEIAMVFESILLKDPFSVSTNFKIVKQSDWKEAMVPIYQYRIITHLINWLLSHGGRVESQDNKKLCFCTASLSLNSRLAEACRAKTKLFISPETQHGRRVISIYCAGSFEFCKEIILLRLSHVKLSGIGIATINFNNTLERQFWAKGVDSWKILGKCFDQVEWTDTYDKLKNSKKAL